jgi:hypothetical protein
MRGSLGLLILLACFCGRSEAYACEPILPLFHALTGASFVTKSFWGLAAAVLIKCVAFACYEQSLSWPKAFFFMLLGNVVTSVIGFVVAGFAAAGSAWFITLPLLFAVTLWPARQLLPRLSWPWLKVFSPSSLAGFTMLLLFLSYVFFGIARSLGDPPGWGYWLAKAGGLYLAIIISMVITTFYEEWMVYVLARKPKEPPTFYQAVVRANMLTLFIIMGCTAAYILPQRFASPFFTFMER